MTDTQQAFYVATNGNDSWSGRLAAPNADGTDGPFATLDRAQGAMRTTGIRDTYIRGGTYAMARTVTLTGADNGVRILAYPGETPVFSGGERVGGFTAIGGGLYAAATAATGLDLSIGGIRQKVAQTGDWTAGDAKSGWSFLEAVGDGGSKTSLRASAGDGAMAAVLAAGVQPGTMVQTFDTERLSDTIIGVASTDAGSRTITFTQSAKYALRSGGTYRLLNDDAFIRDAGEFAWQAETGQLLVKPQDPGMLLAQGAVVARLGTLLALNGASGVTLQGLTFADTTWDGAALTLTNAPANSIAGNRFVNVGTALTLTGSSGNVIEANRLEHLGSSGIKVTYGSNANRISANRITDIGEVLKDGAGIQLYGTSGTLISGNDIRNSPRYGISIKNWDGATVNTDTVVEYNRLYNTMTETADGGAIEMLGRSNLDTRTTIRGNDIRGVGGLATDGSGWLDRHKSFGIYLDDMANGVTVQDNFIQNTGWASVFIHGGDSNTVTNNLATLSNPRERFIRLEWVPSAGSLGLLSNNHVTGNVISSSTGVDYWEFWTPGSYSVTGNLLQGTRGLTGGDTVAAGLFVNPAAGDYRLTSAVTALGIHDLNWAQMGTAPLSVPAIALPTAVPASLDLGLPAAPPVSASPALTTGTSMVAATGATSATLRSTPTAAAATASMIVGNDAVDVLQGGAGHETILCGGGDDWGAGGDGADQLFGNAGNDSLYGNAGADLLYGGRGADRLYGGRDDDGLTGDEGDDWLMGDLGNDRLVGNGGRDQLVGNGGSDTLFGGRDEDTLSGGQGDDWLSGDLGADWLSGDLGNDTLSGGAGGDLFVFSGASGQDVITDFSAAEGDRIGLAPGQGYVLSANAAGEAVIVFATDHFVTLAGLRREAFDAAWIQSIG